jgi:hypothetical protein
MESPIYKNSDNFVFLFCVWKQLAGTALFKVTDMISVGTSQRDKWCRFEAKAVPQAHAKLF